MQKGETGREADLPGKPSIIAARVAHNPNGRRKKGRSRSTPPGKPGMTSPLAMSDFDRSITQVFGKSKNPCERHLLVAPVSIL